MTRLPVIALLFLLPALKSFGQSSASVPVSATIMEPVGAQKLEDLRFGTFAMDAKPGTIELRSTGSTKIKGGITLYTDTAAGLALFRVINNGHAYSISVPSVLVVSKKDGIGTMTIGSFTIFRSSENMNAPAQTLAIGATLYAGAFQGTGAYVAVTPLAVTVNYN